MIFIIIIARTINKTVRIFVTEYMYMHMYMYYHTTQFMIMIQNFYINALMFISLYTGTFGVTLKNNIYAQRMNLTSTYKLRVTLQDITLLSEDLNERIAMWMYSQLRNFRTNDECVEIEAGRAAETGPGTIIFLSPYAKEIYSLIKNNVRALAKQARTSQTASFSQIDASPYEIPARSIATLQGKGLRLHHDARSHDALNQHVLPQCKLH